MPRPVGDVLQIERPKPLERKVEPAADMIVHRARDTDTARRTLGLQPRRHIHALAVHVGAVRDHVADIDADAEANARLGRSVAVMARQLLLHLHRAAHRAVDAVEHHQQRIAARVDDPAAMLGDRRIDQVAAERSQPLERADVVQPDQAAVAHHVGMHHGGQPALGWRAGPI